MSAEKVFEEEVDRLILTQRILLAEELDRAVFRLIYGEEGT